MASTEQTRMIRRAEIAGLLRDKAATQADLARELGIPESAVSNLLNGRRAIKNAELPKAARFLGVTIPEMLALLGFPSEDAA